jgi:dTDP-4-amino-4,6-dideoxygalactose transaminase
VAVHFAGYPAPVDVLRDLCADRGVALIEDAAHAPAAKLDGKPLGTFGLSAAFSLFSNKVLSVGEGGMIATDDDEVARRSRILRSQGMSSGTWDRHSGRTDTYDVAEIGYNYRLDEPRAALAVSRLPRLDEDIERRRVLTRRYRELLSDVPGVEFPFPDDRIDDSSAYVMPMLVDASNRDAFRGRLQSRGIQTSIFYPPIHLFTAYRALSTSLPLTELTARREVTLPLYPHMTEAEQDQVIEGVMEELSA